MALGNCNIHGSSYYPEMCEHLKSDLDKGIFSPFHYLPILSIRICNNCFEQYNVQEIIDVLCIGENQDETLETIPDYFFEEERFNEETPEIFRNIETIYTLLNKNSYFECIKCMDQFELDHARKNHLPLPFKAFENTIINEKDSRLTNLHTILDDYLALKGYLLETSTESYEMTRACQINSGWIKCPLTIKIYGIENQEEQNTLLKIIDDYFKEIPEKQRKIMFLESLNWIVTKKTDDSYGVIESKTRDTEKLLSEHITL